MATCSAEAPIVSTARIGSAVRVIRLPRALTAWADQNLRKSACRQSPSRGHGNHAGGRVSGIRLLDFWDWPGSNDQSRGRAD